MINLIKKANQIRKNLVGVAVKNKAGHIASSLSCVDILVALYYKIMNIYGYHHERFFDRDRLVFSKAHGCYGLYAILADIGYIKKEDWYNFYKGSSLMGCVERNVEHGIEASCGSLGHGLPIAVGVAFGAKLQNKRHKVYCIVGDGEMQEGSNWEAIQFAVKHKLSNLIIIIDANNLQAMDCINKVLTPERSIATVFLRNKLAAFGCEIFLCFDGHNTNEIVTAIDNLIKSKPETLKPKILIVNTIKGYGLLCMENIAKFHFRIPTEEELKKGNRYDIC